MAILISLLNTQLYEIMYKSIDRKTAPALALQVLMNNYSIFGAFLTLKVFDLVVV